MCVCTSEANERLSVASSLATPLQVLLAEETPAQVDQDG